MKFSIKDFFSKYDQICTFTEEILNEKFHFCVVFEPSECYFIILYNSTLLPH